MIHQKHLDLLLDLDTDKNPHSGGALLDHLRGTHDLLDAWGNDQAVCIGGLFHSIYGTEAYHTRSATLEDRHRIRAVIGERAERLAFLFAVSNRGEFFEALDRDEATLWNRIHEQAIPVVHDELRDLIEMELANFVEFMPRLPFTYDELAAFEGNVERAKDLITTRAHTAVKAAVETKRGEVLRTESGRGGCD